MNPHLLRTLFVNSPKHNDDKECDCGQPTWLALALAILPAVLPVLVEKLGNLLMEWFFGKETKEQVEEEEEDVEFVPKKKRKSSKKEKSQ